MDKTRQERYNMIYGNTARKIEDLAAEPVRRQPRKTRKARPRREHQVKESTRQNQKRAMSIDLAFIKVAGLCVIAVASFFYLSERTKVLNQKAALTDAKTQLNTLQVENEDLNLEIEQSIRFDTVETAAKKYGMVKPDSKHTLRYESQDAEYIRQYGKIPKAD